MIVAKLIQIAKVKIATVKRKMRKKKKKKKKKSRWRAWSVLPSTKRRIR